MAAPHKPQSKTYDQSGDRSADASPIVDLVGTMDPGGAPTQRALNNTFKNAATLNGSGPALIDMEDYDTILLRTDYLVGDGTGLELRAFMGELADPTVEDLTKIIWQELREKNDTDGEVNYEKLTHKQIAGTGVGEFIFKRKQRFLMVEFRDTNVAASTAAVAADFQGQRREGR
jgi:hypothetical protein